MTLPNNTNATVRELSRLDCVALALQHNLDIRISRHEPRIAYYNLERRLRVLRADLQICRQTRDFLQN